MLSITKEQSIHLDLILKTLVEKKKRNAESIDTINQELLPEKSRDYCLSLFYILAEYYPKLLYPKTDLNENCFWATEYVPAFIHNGGFTSIFEKAYKEQEIEREKEELNLEKLKYDVKNSKRIYRTYWWTFGISISGLVLALGKIIFDIITKK